MSKKAIKFPERAEKTIEVVLAEFLAEQRKRLKPGTAWKKGLMQQGTCPGRYVLQRYFTGQPKIPVSIQMILMMRIIWSLTTITFQE